MKGCLQVIGGVVVLLVALVMCAGFISSNQHPDSTSYTSSRDASSGSDTDSSTEANCNSSVDHTNQAWKDYNTGDYSGGYKNADTAVSLADDCQDGGDRDSAKGFALSARAFNEHHLSLGDSRTDLNQAEQLLASCQSDVGYYGTHDAALCETQEQNDISTQTNWEMNE
jgi:hypothetical protein